MMINTPDWNKDDYDREMDEYPDHEGDYDYRDMSIDDMVMRNMWRGCIEDK